MNRWLLSSSSVNLGPVWFSRSSIWMVWNLEFRTLVKGDGMAFEVPFCLFEWLLLGVIGLEWRVFGMYKLVSLHDFK